jgi:hypothetical protein
MSDNLLDSEQGAKRRRTKFDVLPPCTVDQNEMKIDEDNSSEEIDEKHITWITTPLNQSFLQPSSFIYADNIQYIPAEHPAFKLRIQKALQKNFDYLERYLLLTLKWVLFLFRRLDMIAASKVTSVPVSQSVLPRITPSSQTGKSFRQNLLNKDVKPVVGIKGVYSWVLFLSMILICFRSRDW